MSGYAQAAAPWLEREPLKVWRGWRLLSLLANLLLWLVLLSDG